MQIKSLIFGKILFLFLLLITSSELFVRYILGIGDPILFKSHPTIEYEQLPSQNVQVFHNKIYINSLGMRSDELVFPKQKNIKRILIYGDSVIFGGNLLSDNELATNLLNRKLNKNENNFEIANISSGSWGPGNWLSHINERGLYEADHVLIVINSNDYYDVPKYQSIVNNPRLPYKKPLFASTFLFKRYLLPKLNTLYLKISSNIFSAKEKNYSLIKKNSTIPYERKNSLEDLKKIINILKKNNISVSVIQFWDRNEFKNNKPRSSNLLIRDLLKKNKINVLQSIGHFKSCSFNAKDLYIDNIHPFKPIAQECLANLMKKSLESNPSLEINNKIFD